MSKATKATKTKLKPFQKLLTIMISGKPVTIDEIDTLLGKEIYMYRISTYMWHIKTMANGVVRAVKTGRKVNAYQLVNVDQVKDYMTRVGITGSGYTPGTVVKKQSISKLSDLNSNPVNQVIADQPVAQAA